MISFTLRGNVIVIVYYHYCFQSKLRLSTRIKIDKKNWNSEKGKAKKDSIEFNGKSINKELFRHEQALNNAINYFDEHSGFSKQNITEKYYEYLNNGVPRRKGKTRILFLDYYEQYVEGASSLKDSTKEKYKVTFKHLKIFFGNRKPNFEDINLDFYEKFNKYLFDRGLAKNTISNYWKHIKKVMSEGVKRKLHNNLDYKQFKRFSEESDTIYLTLEEIDRIYKLNLSGNEEIIRDYFVAACFLGLRHSDWDQIKESNIDKNGFLRIRSTKTDDLLYIPINKYVRKILKKYKGTSPKLPTLQTINRKLKIIGFKAKITDQTSKRMTKGNKSNTTNQPKYKLIASHTARRSFATILVSQGVSPVLIMKITGHQTYSSFKQYVRISNVQVSTQLKGNSFFK